MQFRPAPQPGIRLDRQGRGDQAIVSGWKASLSDHLKPPLAALIDLLFLCGVPGATSRSDYGPEIIARAVRDWIAAIGAKTAYIEPGSP